MVNSFIPETESREKAPSRADRFIQKITSLENFFLILNFVLELPSAFFDQLSSVHNPQFPLLSMLLSFAVFLISVTDLVYKGKQERVCLMKKGLLPWFYGLNSKPFGTFPDIIGLVCAFFQCFFASIAFVFLFQHMDNPVKVSTWPIFFAFGLLYTKLSGNLVQTNSDSDIERPTVGELEQLHISEERRVPDFFLCPIFQHIMHDPHVAADGYTYEGEALRSWFETGHETSPMTNLKLSHLNLTPNHTLRQAIQDWLSKS